MSWRVVARREALDVRRSRGVRTLVGVFVVVGVAAVVLPAVAFEGRLSAERALAFLVAPLRLVVGVTGLLAGHAAVAGSRSGGQLKLALGLPIRRSALVTGAFAGRAAVVLSGTGVGLLAVALAFLAVHGSIPLGALAGFGALLGLLALAITALAVGLSAASSTSAVAAMGAVGAFVAFEFFWGVVPAGAHFLVEGTLPGAVVPPWVVLLERLQPFAALEAAADLVLPRADRTLQVSNLGADATGGAPPTLADRLAGAPPAYLDPWVGVGTLTAWIVVSLSVGIHRFNRTDL